MATQSPSITARNIMADWRTDSGTKPFSMANSVQPEDRSGPVLAQASAILSVLSASCFDALTVSDAGKTSEFQAVHPAVLAAALDGIGTLVDLANFMVKG